MSRGRGAPAPNRAAAAACGRHESACGLGSHHGLDVSMTECRRHRYPMASVDDVVAIRSLDDLDRREGVTSAVSERDPLPARAHEFRGGAEARVEVNGRFQRPDDGLERNDLDPAQRFRPAGAILQRPRTPVGSPSPEPASGPTDRMCQPGATEVGLRVEDRHPGGVSERPEHLAPHDKRRRTSCHRASAYSHPLPFPCFSLVTGAAVRLTTTFEVLARDGREVCDARPVIEP